MTDTYTAWDGNSYPWPPPEGWHEAVDGRYWAPGTGPSASESTHLLEPDSSVSPPEETTLESAASVRAAGILHSPAPIDENDVTVNVALELGNDQLDPVLLGSVPSVEAKSFDPPTEDIVPDQPAGTGLADLFEPATNLQPSGHDIGFQGGSFDAQPAMAQPGLHRHAGVWDGYGHDTHKDKGKIVAISMVALVAVAAIIIGSLAITTDIFAGGTPTTVLVSPEDGDGNPAGGVAAQTAKAGDKGSDDDAPDQSTDVAASPDRDLVAQFRQLLNTNGLTSGNLLPYELTNFGNAFCRYAQASSNPGEFDVYRTEAITKTATELNNQELNLVIDAALITFCPTEADRLGVVIEPVAAASED